MKHPNIVTFIHAFYTKGPKAEEVYLNIVMDYMPETVSRAIKIFGKLNQQVPPIIVKLYTY